MTRVRVRWSKLGKIRWTSHRDAARMWERALRRVELPVAYSSGFSPRPKLSFGLALPTGCESVAEYLDVELDEGCEVDLVSLPDRLSAALPAGVDATAATAIAVGTPSLQEAVISCSWRWAVNNADGSGTPDREDLARRVDHLLVSPSIVVSRTRKGGERTDDVRPAILSLRVEGESAGSIWLAAELACQVCGLRPSELTSALGSDLEGRDICRINQWMLRDGARVEPLEVAEPAGATSAPRALERAS